MGMKSKGYAKGGMKQGFNARLDDSLGSKNGSKSQSMKSRRNESEGMEKSMGKRKFSGNKSSGQGSDALSGFTNMGTMKNSWQYTALHRVCCISNHNI